MTERPTEIIVAVDTARGEDSTVACIAMHDREGNVPIMEFVEYTPERVRQMQERLAARTRLEAIEYADLKMMPRRMMLGDWKKARKAMRGKK